jgi:hypothetical protein
MPPEISKKMNEDEKYLCSQNYRDVNQEKIYMAERRGCELADEFTRLEVQIAVILFGLTGIFLSSPFGTKLLAGSFSLKISYTSIFFLLIVSLGLGLIHIKRREMFWDDHMKIRLSRFLKWDQVIKKDTTYEEAMAFHMGTMHGKIGLISKSPNWTWIFQTICLGLAVIILFVMLVLFLF